jgi:hypothetical protein
MKIIPKIFLFGWVLARHYIKFSSWGLFEQSPPSFSNQIDLFAPCTVQVLIYSQSNNEKEK